MNDFNVLYSCILLFVNSVYAWDSQQLEVFDVVDEVKVNFYEFLSVPKDAPTNDIKASFRRLSRQLHPDKNSAADAEESFRNLVSVYEVLKDPVKRKYYDEVLINGLPNWRSAVYYYRHVRRIGLLELAIILVVLISTGQYLVGWASYLETKLTLEQVRKGRKKAPPILDIPKPSLKDTLPIQIPRLIWRSLISLPWAFRELKEIAKEQIESRQQEEEVEEPAPRIRPVKRKKQGFILPDGPTFKNDSTSPIERTEEINYEPQTPVVSGGLWTDDDLADLVQLINKYPGVTPNRWAVIANALGRSVSEVTYMANTLKTNGYRLPSQNSEEVEEQPRVKRKTKGGKLEVNSTNPNVANWAQEEQQALENAMLKYPKGYVDRWDRIADCVADKTKDECILRYKYLVDLVKKQKEDKEEKQQPIAQN